MKNISNDLNFPKNVKVYMSINLLEENVNLDQIIPFPSQKSTVKRPSTFNS